MAQQQQQQRSGSKQAGYRKSTNDLFEVNNDTRFRTMYSAAFVDHTKRESRDQTHNLMSPIARQVHMVAGKITTP